MIEVILKTKVPHLGAEADLVKVNPGYARNYLIPKGLAAPATTTYKQQVLRLQKLRAEREATELNDANQLAGRINKMTITFQMESGKGQEKLFGSITASDILDRLVKEDVHLDKKKIKLAHPLKDVGTHQVEIHLHSEVNASLKVVLVVPKTAEDEEQADKKKDFKKGKFSKDKPKKKSTEKENG